MEDFKETVAERDNNLPKLVEQLVEKKLAGQTQTQRRTTGRAPRPLGGSTSLIVEAKAPSASKLDLKYLEARRSLRLWPVPGPSNALKAATIAFLREKLHCPEDWVAIDEIELRRINSTPNFPVKDQCLLQAASEIRSKHWERT